MKIIKKRFVAIIYRTGWLHISFGFHIDFRSPNIEIHLPFCFARIGIQIYYEMEEVEMLKEEGLGIKTEWK